MMLTTLKYGKLTIVDKYSHTDFVDENGVIITSILIDDGDVYITVVDAKDVDEEEGFKPIDVKEVRYFIKLYESGEVRFTFNIDEGDEEEYPTIREMIKTNKEAHDMMNRRDYRHLFGDGLEMVEIIFEEYSCVHG